MKTVSGAMAAHLQGEVLTLATCWLVTRQDGAQLGFTDHDQDLNINGLYYQAMTGYTRTAIQTTSNFAVDQLNLEGLLDSAAIDENDVRKGLYDLAEIRIFQVNWANLSMGILRERRGWLGELTMKRGLFVAEMRGLAQAFSRQIIELITPDCRADLYDPRCKINPAAFTVQGTVTAVVDPRRRFTDNGRGEPDGWYQHGLLIWTSGANQGARMEIDYFTAGTFATYLKTFQDIAVGDTYEARAGCDKSVDTCRVKFDNILNFRGEPFVSGMDAMLRYPDARN